MRRGILLTKFIIGAAHVPLVRLREPLFINRNEFSRRYGIKKFVKNGYIIGSLGVTDPSLEIGFRDRANRVDISLF